MTDVRPCTLRDLTLYLGWARGGAFGAVLVGLGFVLPSFAMVVALAWT